MKSVPLPELPWEAQLMFWILMLLVGIAFGVAIWFLLRYIKGQDDINTNVQQKFESISKKVEDLKTSVNSSHHTLLKEMQDIQKAAMGVRQDTLEDFSQIKDDVREVKGVVKVVETHQTVLKTIVVKLNDLMIFKTKKD